jgi:hypothetical protein
VFAVYFYSLVESTVLHVNGNTVYISVGIIDFVAVGTSASHLTYRYLI